MGLLTDNKERNQNGIADVRLSNGLYSGQRVAGINSTNTQWHVARVNIPLQTSLLFNLQISPSFGNQNCDPQILHKLWDLYNAICRFHSPFATAAAKNILCNGLENDR